MPLEKIYKTIFQYNKKQIPTRDMEKLKEIAEDCQKVRNYVYERYGGIGGLTKIYPGYTVQNEMTKSGLRERLGLPSVYFHLAIFDALGDIKSQWTRTKKNIEKNIRANELFTPEDKHYLRFVMKQSRCFEAILNNRKVVLQGGWTEAYHSACTGVDMHRLNQYLRRQVRRHLVKPYTKIAEGFTVSPKGYRYADHGIYLSMKESRKRLFIMLTDNNCYNRQIYIRLFPEEGNISINVPVEVRQKHPVGYEGEIGLALGMHCMFVTDRGNVYGEQYMRYQSALTDYVREKLSGHRRNARYNPGMKKYNAGRMRLEAALHNYVNAQINRMLDAEKPRIVYFPKLPAVSKAGVNKKVNASVGMWQRGFIKSRLVQKCWERSIKLVEVFAGGISTECCECGAAGTKDENIFCCETCGARKPERQNTAANVLKRGRLGS